MKLGMTDAFDSLAADFSRMVKPTGPLRPYIDIVQHNTALEVSEAGVLAAAATDVEMKAGRRPPEQPGRAHPAAGSPLLLRPGGRTHRRGHLRRRGLPAESAGDGDIENSPGGFFPGAVRLVEKV